MRLFLPLVWLLLAAGPAMALDLTVGAQQPLPLDGVIDRIAVGDPEVLTATPVADDELLLLGTATGSTNLIVWLRGESAPRTFVVRVTPDLAPLREALRADPLLASVSVDSRGDRLVLEGEVDTIEAHRRALELARAYGGDDVVDLVQVLQQQMISVEVRFASIATSTLERIGFDFRYLTSGFQFAISGPGASSGYSFQSGSGLSLPGTTPVSDAFNLFLSFPNADLISVLGALSATQLAQILAEPTLTVRSGEHASFIAGGEIPIPVPQGELGGVAIEYKEFGISLDLEATALSNNRILLRVAPEVSELDFTRALSIDGVQVPAILRRGASTTVELGHGQSFVLAGLVSTNVVNDEEQVPWLGDIPILGAFFKRVRATRERQELIIVATPRLVEPVAAGSLPPLPGEETLGYDPTIADMLLNRNRLDDFLPAHGLMP